MKDSVTIFEMGPRDGLQNEKKQISTNNKTRLVDKLTDCGFSKIEVTSFVSPKWVPQMGDAADVLARIRRGNAVIYSALTSNLKGLQQAVLSDVNEVAVFASASESFSQKNINCSIAESLLRYQPVLEEASKKQIPVRGYVSCVTSCPFDGPTSPAQVADVAKKLIEMGCYEISLGDTIGSGTPETIRIMLEEVLKIIPANHLAGHYHDTRHNALKNIEISLDLGLRVFDSTVGGLGGCPFAPGANGNVSSAAVVALMETRGHETGIDLDKLLKVATFAKQLIK